jgi:hypothetical protein
MLAVGFTYREAWFIPAGELGRTWWMVQLIGCILLVAGIALAIITVSGSEFDSNRDFWMFSRLGLILSISVCVDGLIFLLACLACSKLQGAHLVF